MKGTEPSSTKAKLRKHPRVVVDEHSFSDKEPHSSITELDSMHPRSYGTDKSSTKSLSMTDVTMEYKRKAVAFWRDAVNGKRPFKNVQHHYRKVRSQFMLRRWEKDVEAGGSRAAKLSAIHLSTWNQYRACMKEHKEVHDWNLRAFALEAARTVSKIITFQITISLVRGGVANRINTV